MIIKFILTDSIADIQTLSSGQFHIDNDFMDKIDTRIIVIGDNANFDVLHNSIIKKELDSVLRADEDNINYSIYTHLDLTNYNSAIGYDDFIANNEINPLEDYFIQYDNYADYIFSKEQPMAFADILHGLKNDLMVAHRLENGTSICVNQSTGEFITEYGKVYNLTSDDILADDWINSSYTLYPTTIKYDPDNSMCKMYFDLHDSKYILPYSEIFYFITHGKTAYWYSRFHDEEIIIFTKYKDRFNFFKSVLNKIVELNLIKTKVSSIEVFDPSLPVQNEILKINDKKYFDIHNYNIEAKKLRIIIDGDSYTQDEIDSFMSLALQDRILVVSLKH